MAKEKKNVKFSLNSEEGIFIKKKKHYNPQLADNSVSKTDTELLRY